MISLATSNEHKLDNEVNVSISLHQHNIPFTYTKLFTLKSLYSSLLRVAQLQQHGVSARQWDALAIIYVYICVYLCFAALDAAADTTIRSCLRNQWDCPTFHRANVSAGNIYLWKPGYRVSPRKAGNGQDIEFWTIM